MKKPAADPMTESAHLPIDVNTAIELISAAMPNFGASPVALDAASDRVLRQSVEAERDQPPFDRATMDGISVAHTALERGVRAFKIAGIQAAGQAKQTLPDTEHCFEVMTGAVMPEGTDTVIPVERISVTNDSAELETGYNPEIRQFVHPQGSDHGRNELLLNPGIRISGPDMAILTAAGKPEVMVANDPKISVIATGDELVDVGKPIADHQIRSSNDRAIETILFGRGYQNVNRAHLRDDRTELLKQVRKLHANNDVLILSGGVSMGKYDYVPAILAALGVELIFHKILQRPGLPMWFGVSDKHKPVFALPGNPVSTLVCLVRYVIPALDCASGQNQPAPEFVPLAQSVDFAADLCWFLPVKLTSNAADGWTAQPRPTNTSGDFVGLRETAGFVELPRGQDNFPAEYKARLFRW